MRKLLLLCTLGALIACQKDDSSNENTELDSELETILQEASNGVGKSHFLLPESEDYTAIPQDPKNPITKTKVDLGRLLYHETGLARIAVKEEGMGTYSCSSCHFASAGFQASRIQGIGEGGIGFGANGEGRIPNSAYQAEELDVQPVRSPSAMNGAYQTNQLWNGQFGATGLNTGTEAQWSEDTPIATNHLGYEGLETQAIAGLKVHRMALDEDFFTSMPQYKAMFDEAFPGIPEANRYDREQAGLAIAAYERTLLANQSPWQLWLRGDHSALTDQEKRGAILFFDKAKCGNCHNGPALNTMDFFAIGMKDLDQNSESVFKTLPNDNAFLGRGSFTGKEQDNYKFKVPQLYNLASSPFYGHGGSFRSIREVIEYKNQAIPENERIPQSKLAPEFEPLGLNNQEIDDITAFLSNGLFDPELKRYEPESLPSGHCFPFNDEMARRDLGCD